MTANRNPSDQPFTAAEIEKFLNGGREADFLLELEVLKLLDDWHYKVDFCGRYEDPVSQKTREFDLQAWQTGAEDQTLVLAAECKNVLANSPILALCSPRTSKEAEIEWAEKNERPVATSTIINPFHVKRGPWQPYIDNRYDCRAVVQIEGKGRETEDPSFQVVGNNRSGLHTKWEQATASLSAVINKVAEGKLSPATRCYFLPFLVVPDETLWAVRYDLQGNRIAPPALVDSVFQSIWLQCKFAMKPDPKNFHIAKLHIVTLSGFKDFLYDAALRYGLRMPH